jgi:hypothetical protein
MDVLFPGLENFLIAGSKFIVLHLIHDSRDMIREEIRFFLEGLPVRLYLTLELETESGY